MVGCTSAHEIGLIKALEDGNYNYINRAKMSPRESLMAAYDADVFLSSANAITSDGVMVNIDGKFQSGFLYCPGTEEGGFHCGNE